MKLFNMQTIAKTLLNRRAYLTVGSVGCVGLYAAGYQRFKRAQFASLYENLEAKQVIQWCYYEDYQQEYLRGNLKQVRGFW